MRKLNYKLWVLMSLQTTPNYSSETGKFHNIAPEQGLAGGFWEMAGASYRVLAESKTRAPKVKLPEIRPDLDAFTQADGAFRFVWFGHSTLMLRLENKTILVDPVFAETASPVSFLTRRFQAPVLQKEELPPIDAIVISHDHYDHLDKGLAQFFAGTDTKYIVPLKVGDALREWGVPATQIVELNWDQSFALGDVTLTATVAHHFSGRGLFDRMKTLWASWVIKGKTQSIYYSGDTAYTDHFRRIGEQHGPFDFAFIENGQYNVLWPDAHMQPEQSIQAALDLKAKAFIPVHWGMFDLSLHHWSEPVVRSSRLAREQGLPYLSPRLGELVDSGNMPEFTDWWTAVLEEEKQL